MAQRKSDPFPTTLANPALHLTGPAGERQPFSRVQSQTPGSCPLSPTRTAEREEEYDHAMPSWPLDPRVAMFLT
jgi:hypothetical protein